jgi:hypothetical protein
MTRAGYYEASYPMARLLAPDPHITTLVPNTGSAAAGAILVTVNGTDFEATSVIEIAQQARPTTFVSATQLTTSYDPTVPGTVQFTVRNANGEESNSVPFTVGALAADDVSAMTVEDVKAFVAAHPDLLSEVHGLERAGKRRTSLLAWLKQLLDEEAASQ